MSANYYEIAFSHYLRKRTGKKPKSLDNNTAKENPMTKFFTDLSLACILGAIISAGLNAATQDKDISRLGAAAVVVVYMRATTYRNSF